MDKIFAVIYGSALASSWWAAGVYGNGPWVAASIILTGILVIYIAVEAWEGK